MDIVERLRKRAESSMPPTMDELYESADEIERLRAEVLKWGDFIDTFPCPALFWHSHAPMPPEFALKMHREWWSKAKDAFAGSLYLELYRKREADKK